MRIFQALLGNFGIEQRKVGSVALSWGLGIHKLFSGGKTDSVLVGQVVNMSVSGLRTMV